MLAHFWGDLSMPYHTDQAAQEADAEHEAYELLVNDLTQDADRQAGLVGREHQLERLEHAQRAHGRHRDGGLLAARYQTVHDNFEPNDNSLSNPVENVTAGRADPARSGDLADLIQSVPEGRRQPAARRLVEALGALARHRRRTSTTS